MNALFKSCQWRKIFSIHREIIQWRNLSSLQVPMIEKVVYKFLLEIKSNAVSHDVLNVKMILMCCYLLMLSLLDHIINYIEQIGKLLDYGGSITQKSVNFLLYFRIKEHVAKHDILPRTKFGFRKGYSCTRTLLCFVNSLLRDVDNGKSCFNTVSLFKSIRYYLLPFIISHS